MTVCYHLQHSKIKKNINFSRKSLVILVSIFYFRNAMDVGQNRVHQNQHTTKCKPRSEVDEESTVYRGYTNPNVQSRSFKILQESLNYSEAPQGNNIELHDTRGFGFSVDSGTPKPLIVKRVEVNNLPSKLSFSFCSCFRPLFYQFLLFVNYFINSCCFKFRLVCCCLVSALHYMCY